MISESYNTKRIYFKAYENLLPLERDLKLIKEQGPIDSKISILGKSTQFYLDQNLEVQKGADTLKIHWWKILGNTANFGRFSNPEIGNIFVVGALAPTFLYEIGGKTLGMLASGPYGILRGIGASETQATSLLKILNNNNYLLIYRGSENKLKNYIKILEPKKY